MKSTKPKRTPLTLEVCEQPCLTAHNTYRLRLCKPEGVVFRSGQSMKFDFKNEKKEDGAWRTPSFTVVSAPYEPFLEFVFRVTEDKATWSPTKRSLVSLKVGEAVPMLSVLSDESDEVIYPAELEKEVPVVMLAGGVGVAPFISMMRHAEHVGDRRLFYLLYANPTKDAVAYSDEVKQYTASALNIKVQQFLTQESVDGFSYGRFKKEHISAVMHSRRTIPLFFVSGPEKMVEETKGMLEALRIPAEKIRVKKYKGYTGLDDTIRE